MGFIQSEITLKNPKNNRQMKVIALADTGALLTCLPENISIQLALEKLEDREVKLADGSLRTVPYVGPLIIQFENRQCFAGALVFGDEPLLGAVPMEDLDVVLVPSQRIMTVNPDHPFIAGTVVK